MATVRTFLALEVSGGVIAAAKKIIDHLAEVDNGAVRWSETSQLHLTMKFFGDVAPELTNDICRRVQPILDETEPFEFEVAGVGAFPKIERPRTIWAGVGDGSEALIALAKQIEEAVEPLGFRPERRRFRPHLTLGRVKGSEPNEMLASQIKELGDEYELGVTIADEIRLLSSELKRHGPVYECMATLEFAE